MLDERKLEVLKAIVTDYVASQEPVGSKALVERHQLNVSPATVRNDMAVLEDEGYLMQPYTSAGRVPTDKGYRLFVDRLATVKPMSIAERRAIQRFMDGAVDMDDIVRRTVHLLASITHQVAIMQYPYSNQTRIRHVELVNLTGDRVLAILIRSSGTIEQHSFSLPDCSEEFLARTKERMNAAISDRAPKEAIERLEASLEQLSEQERLGTAPVVSVLLQMLATNPSTRVVVGGVPNLTQFGTEYESAIKPVLEALEEQVVLLRLLGESVADRPGEVQVRIGRENPYEPLRSTSVVASAYGSSDEAWARLGVVGPTRMDYPSTIAAVRAVARYVGRFLAEG